jgi:hypothetical protein
MNRWLERLTIAGMFVIFAMTGMLVWAFVFFRGLR